MFWDNSLVVTDYQGTRIDDFFENMVIKILQFREVLNMLDITELPDDFT